MEYLKKFITDINDFPMKGILFKDINPIYQTPEIWHQIMIPLEEVIRSIKPDLIAGIESRGFISAAALSYKLEIGFIPIRKANKLPGKVIGLDYELEYGIDRLEIQSESLDNNKSVLIIDDLLATGGTASTAGKLIKAAGCNLIGYAFLVELIKLNGRKNLENDLLIESVLKY